MIYKSGLWFEDIDKIISELPEIDDLAGNSVLITGICGLICSAVADILIRYNETHNKIITIFAAARSVRKLSDRFGVFFEKEYFHFVEYDASKMDINISLPVNYIIHGAGNAFPSVIIKEPVETMISSFNGVLTLLNYAKKYGAKRLLYISSSEVYGMKGGDKPYREDEYGYIDLLDSRNSYSVGKRAAETLCVSYADEYGVESVIARPGHIYGPTALRSDNRVSSAWAYAVASGKNIIMKSDGSQIRSYCYCLDCASAILKLLLLGENTHAYNISNPDSIIDIKSMAKILTESAGVQLQMEFPTLEEKKGFNPMSNSSLNSDGLLKLGWRSCFDAKTGFAHTVQIIRESNEIGQC